MLKSDLRKSYKSKRKELSENSLAELSGQIASNLKENFEQADITHIFLSIEKFQEVNTNPIIENLRHNDLITCTGITDFNKGTMNTVAFTEEIEIKISDFGVPEPIGGPAIDNLEIDRVIIPLLAYDNNGNRVGYGKGFYDRFLASCRPDVEKVGLSFFEPVSVISDVNENDIKLDFCVTPKRIYRF